MIKGYRLVVEHDGTGNAGGRKAFVHVPTEGRSRWRAVHKLHRVACSRAMRWR
jgi:hypothetical protein